MALILSVLMYQSCCDRQIFTQNVSPPTSIGLDVSNLVHGVLSWAYIQYANVRLQPEIFQEDIKELYSGDCN